MHNKLVAAGMRGCAYFGVEAFEQETSSSILAAILVWDLKSGEESHAHPRAALRSPLELFQQNACHGGTELPWVLLVFVAVVFYSTVSINLNNPSLFQERGAPSIKQTVTRRCAQLCTSSVRLIPHPFSFSAPMSVFLCVCVSVCLCVFVCACVEM
jgi:hypothetical protein